MAETNDRIIEYTPDWKEICSQNKGLNDVLYSFIAMKLEAEDVQQMGSLAPSKDGREILNKILLFPSLINYDIAEEDRKRIEGAYDEWRYQPLDERIDGMTCDDLYELLGKEISDTDSLQTVEEEYGLDDTNTIRDLCIKVVPG